MRIRPGFQVYWRGQGASQVGLDPRCAVRLEGLSDAEQELLDMVPRAGDTVAVQVRGRSLGIPRERVSALLDQLELAGVLVAELPLGEAGPDERYWHRAAAARLPTPGLPVAGPGGGRAPLTAARAQRTVAIVGVDQVGIRMACALAQAGVGTLLLRDRRVVLVDDVGAGVFRPSDVGGIRQDVGVAVLRSVWPHVAVSARAGTRPDLVVLIDHGVADPVPVRALMREDIPHVPVVIRDLDVAIGPLVRPGLGVCTRCLDLHRCDLDERWPAVATQVSAHPPSGVESSLAWLGASLAAHQVLAILDGRPAAVEGATVEVSAFEPLGVRREWSVHPDCGCSASTFDAEHPGPGPFGEAPGVPLGGALAGARTEPPGEGFCGPPGEGSAAARTKPAAAAAHAADVVRDGS